MEIDIMVIVKWFRFCGWFSIYFVCLNVEENYYRVNILLNVILDIMGREIEKKGYLINIWKVNWRIFF